MQLAVVTVYISLVRDPKRADATSRIRLLDLLLCIWGVFSLCGFYVVGAVAEDSTPLAHIIGALIGFWGEWLYCLLLTIRLFEARRRLKVERWSLLLKFLCVFGALAALTAFGIVATLFSFTYDEHIHSLCAFFEWIASICVAIFQFSIVNEVLVDVTILPLDPNSLNSIQQRDIYEPLA